MNRPNPNKWLSLAVALVAPFLVVTDLFVVNLILPYIKKDLQASDAEIQLVMAAYLLGYAVFLITGARMGDQFGRRRILRWGMIFFVGASASCGLAPSGAQLVLFRFIEGMSAALIMSQSISLMQTNFREGEERNKAFGFYGITCGLACISGLLLGGYVTSGAYGIIGWRIAFFVNLPLGLLAAMLAGITIGETPRNPEQKFDFQGMIILSIGLLTFVFPLIVGREYHWPWWSLLSVAGSLVVIGAFVRHQHRKLSRNQNPLINMRLFRIPEFNVGLFTVLFFFGVQSSYILMESFYVQNGLNLSPVTTSLDFVFYGIGFLISSYISIRYIGRFGKKMLQFGIIVMILALLLQVGTNMAAAGASFGIKFILLIYGLGQGLVLPSLLNIALKSIPVSYSGMAAGVYTTSQQVSSALGVTFIGGLFFYVLRTATGNSFEQAIRYGLYANVVYLLAALVLLQYINKGPVKKQRYQNNRLPDAEIRTVKQRVSPRFKEKV